MSPAGGPEAWGRARNVLCVRLDSIGDVLMTSPAFRALKGSPGRRLTLLTSPFGARAASLIPELDACVPFDAPWVKSGAASTGEQVAAMAERLRGGRFDAAAIFTVYSQNPLPAALLCQLAGIPLRLAHCRENPYGLLTDWVRDPEPEIEVRHEVRRQLDLVASVGCRTPDERLSLRVRAQARERAQRLLDRLGVDRGRPWIALHPGASAASRRYPEGSYVQAAATLIREDGLQVVVTGDASERSLTARVAAEAGRGAFDAGGLLCLEELGGLLSESSMLVTNNTGPAHMAAAVGTPVAVPYALTNPQHTPWGVSCRVLYHDVQCRFCYRSSCPEGHHDCLRRVPPGRVVEAVRELLAPAARSAR